MKILLMKGGLGNQILHYVFMRHIEENMSESVVCDISHYTNYEEHNGFELLDIFPNIKLNMLCNEFKKSSPYFGNQTIGMRYKQRECLNQLGIRKILRIINLQNPHLLSSTSLGLTSQEIIDDKVTMPCYNYYEHIYFNGNFFDERFFNSVKDKILHELKFRPLICCSNKKYLELIQKYISVSVHIRRGDFITFAGGRYNVTHEVYSIAINELREKILNKNQKPCFFVFTNDFEYVEKNIADYGFNTCDEIIFVKGNEGSKSYIDMQLMMYSDYIISNANSSFSRVSALLNSNLVEHIEVGPSLYSR